MQFRHQNSAALLACGVVAVLCGSVTAVDFTPGNLAIYRNDPNSSAPAAVFIDEYTTAGAFVQSIAMPTTHNGSQRAFTTQANASLEGLLNRSADGRYLVLTGYAHALGDPISGTLAQSDASTINRVIGRVGVDGIPDTSTTYDDSGTGSPRSVISDNGTNMWISQGSVSGGTSGGVRFTTFGATGASTNLSQESTDTRAIDIFDGGLYVTTFSNPSPPGGLARVDTTTGDMIGLSNIAATDRLQFFMADMSAEIEGLDTAYIADQRAADEGTGGGLYKFFKDSEGIWLSSGSIAGTRVSAPAVHALRGLTGVEEDGTVTLYATRNASGSGRLLKFVDETGYAGTLTGEAVELIAVSGDIFKGIDFVPVAAPETQPGDHNGDGLVDARDYVVWRADPAGNGGDEGYDDWAENYGAPGGAGTAGAAQSSAVPEPAHWMLVALAGSILMGCIRCPRRQYAPVLG